MSYYSQQQFAGARPRKRGEAKLIGTMLTIVTVATLATNLLVAVLAKNLGANPGFAPLSVPVFGAFTIAGIIGGWLGWRVLERRGVRQRTVLTVIVPLFTAVSMVPDLALLALRFIPGANPAGVFALMVMHLSVVGHAVPCYRLITKRLRLRADGAEIPAPLPVVAPSRQA